MASRISALTAVVLIAVRTPAMSSMRWDAEVSAGILAAINTAAINPMIRQAVSDRMTASFEGVPCGQLI